MSNMIKAKLQFGIPLYIDGRMEHVWQKILTSSQEDCQVIICEANFTIRELQVKGDLAFIVNSQSFQSLIAELARYFDAN